MKMVIDIPNFAWIEDIKDFKSAVKEYDKGSAFDHAIREALLLGTPLPEHLNKIKDDIGRYELDCRFADYSQTDECTICNKNVFGSIYSIIDKYIEGSDSE